jgi:hypothetical protein
MFTARYALSPYIKQICFVFKGLKHRAEFTLNSCTLLDTLNAAALPCYADLCHRRDKDRQVTSGIRRASQI